VRLVVLLSLLACRKEPAAPPPPPAPGDAAPAVARVALDAPPAPPVLDAGPPADAQLVTAEWPTALEFVPVDVDREIGRFRVVEKYPRFRARPKAIADELNAKLAPLIATDFATDRQRTGDYELFCDLITVSRLAVIVRCGQMLGAWSDEDLARGTGGAPGGLTPVQLGYWLQPGLPPVTLDQLAPGVDVGALIAAAHKIDTPECRMSFCELRPDHFTIDSEGIALAPSTHCDRPCTEQTPRIPLAQLAPTHPWAVKLVAWIRQRVEAGESLVKYEATK